MISKKEELIITAEKLFYSTGFHAVGLKRIVKESNVAMMTMYNHFNSKDELIIEVLLHREKQYMNRLSDYVQHKDTQHQDPYFRIALAHAQWINKEGNKGCLFLRAKEEYGEQADHPIVKLVDSHKQRLKEFILKADPQRSENEAVQLTLLMEGATSLVETEPRSQVSEQFLFMAQLLFESN